MKALFVAILALVGSFQAHADLLGLTPTQPPVVNTGVTISSGAKTTIDNKEVDLTTVGNALRWQVVLLKVNVFVGQLLVTEPENYKKNLESLDNQKAVSLVMNLLFSPPAILVAQDFNEAIDANGLSQQDPDVAAFMAIVKSLTFRSGGMVTMLFVRNADGTDTLYAENKVPNAQPQELKPLKLSAQGRHKILSLWFGETADDGSAAFKKAIFQ